MLALEIWLPVVGYEGFYEVSSLGRVMSLPRQTAKGFYGGCILKGNKAPSGHVAVMLSKRGNIRRRMVHQLVAEAFIGPRPEGMETRHLNDVADDNRAENLAYGTSHDNKMDMVRNGGHYYANRTHCPQGHPYDEVNTYRSPKGGRDCRACNNSKTKVRKHTQATGERGVPCTTSGCTSSQTAGGLCPKCYVRKRRAEKRESGWAQRTCPQCEMVFEIAADQPYRKYCSDGCAAEGRRARDHERYERRACVVDTAA